MRPPTGMSPRAERSRRRAAAKAAEADRADRTDQPKAEPRSAEESAYLASTSFRETPSKSLKETPISERKPPPETIGMMATQRPESFAPATCETPATARSTNDPEESALLSPEVMSEDNAPLPLGSTSQCRECGSDGDLYRCGTCHETFHPECLATVDPLLCNRCNAAPAEEAADESDRESRDTLMEEAEAFGSPHPPRESPKRAFQTPTRSSARIRKKTRAQKSGCEDG